MTAKKQTNKVHKVMREFKEGELNIGRSKKRVRSRRQAIAIALSEAGISRRDTKYEEGQHLSGIVPVTISPSYSAAMLSTLRGDTKRKIKVKAPHTKKGYYYREIEASNRVEKPAGKRGQRSNSISISAEGAKIAGLLLGGAVAGGAVAAFATRFISEKGTQEAVEGARQAAQSQAEARVKEVTAKVEQEISQEREKLRTEAEALREQIKKQGEAEIKQELEKRAKAAEDELTRRSQSVEEEVNKRVAEAEEAINRRTAETDEVLNRRVAETEELVTGRIRATEEELNRRVAETEQGLSERQRSAEAELTRQREIAEQDIAQRRRAIDEGLGQRQRELDADFQRRVQELEGQSGEQLRQRQQQLEAEFSAKQQELQRKSEEVQRQAQAEVERINSEAQQRIVREREAALREAQAEIAAISQPKARRPGELVDDDKVGIALGASVSQGLDLNTVAPENQSRRVQEAVKRMIGRRQVEAMQTLAVSFRERTKEIQQMGADVRSRKGGQNMSRVRWEALQQAMMRQSRRENGLVNQMDEIKKNTTAAYQESLKQLQIEASARGNYDTDLIEGFDTRSRKIHQDMQREIQNLMQDLNDIRLDSRGNAYQEGFRLLIGRR